MTKPLQTALATIAATLATLPAMAQVAPEGASEGAAPVATPDAAPAVVPDALPAAAPEVAPAGAVDGAAQVVIPTDAPLPPLATDGLEIIGQPLPGLIGFQPAVTRLAEEIHFLDHYILILITAIVLLVTGLIAWVAIRYNRTRNPNPAAFTHNSPLEVAWTVVPILILVAMGAFSLPVLFDQQRFPEGDVTIKVSGFQWAWNYEYPDEGISFDSYMIGADTQNMLTEDSREQLIAAGYTEDQFRLATDTSVVVPVGKTIVMQVTGTDVIHSWTIPAFGVKQDAIPGRLAQLWFQPEQEGIYFGQCSELCGIAHAYMPITVKVVSEEAYATWLEQMKAGELQSW